MVRSDYAMVYKEWDYGSCRVAANFTIILIIFHFDLDGGGYQSFLPFPLKVQRLLSSFS